MSQFQDDVATQDKLARCYATLKNARSSLTAFGGDPSGLVTEAEAQECSVDMIQWALLRQIDECLAEQ
jgi:hypothetical protein